VTLRLRLYSPPGTMRGEQSGSTVPVESLDSQFLLAAWFLFKRSASQILRSAGHRWVVHRSTRRSRESGVELVSGAVFESTCTFGRSFSILRLGKEMAAQSARLLKWWLQQESRRMLGSRICSKACRFSPYVFRFEHTIRDRLLSNQAQLSTKPCGVPAQ